MKTVLITGSTGFVGGHVARALVREGWHVHALKRSSSSLVGLREAAPTITFYDVDRIPLTTIFETLPVLAAVVHIATNYGRERECASDLLRDNTLFPLHLLERAIAFRSPLFVNTDTCFTTDYKYLQAYTLSKRHFVEWGQVLCGSAATRFVNIKLQHPYGPGDRPGKFVPDIIRQCMASTGDIKLTAGEQRKDFIYVGDVAEAISCVLGKCDDLPCGFSLFECGTGHAVSIRHFVEHVHRLSHSRAKLCFGDLPYRENEIMHSQADIRTLMALGWSPRVSLEQGIQQTLSDSVYRE